MCLMPLHWYVPAGGDPFLWLFRRWRSWVLDRSLPILGAAVVLLGIGVVLSPQLGNSDSEASSGTVLWSLVTVAACVPMCLSSVYKEKALGEQDVGVIFLNGWVAVFQTVMSLPLAIPSAWATHLPLSELPDNVVDGFSVLLGVWASSSRSQGYLTTTTTCLRPIPVDMIC